MKNLEKAIADYEKAKERMENSKAKYEADLKRFKIAESDKIESENMEIVRLVRDMKMSISDLEEFKVRMKNGLPPMAESNKEETERYVEFNKDNETGFEHEKA